jgi:hypothetical protein
VLRAGEPDRFSTDEKSRIGIGRNNWLAIDRKAIAEPWRLCGEGNTRALKVNLGGAGDAGGKEGQGEECSFLQDSRILSVTALGWSYVVINHQFLDRFSA